MHTRDTIGTPGTSRGHHDACIYLFYFEWSMGIPAAEEAFQQTLGLRWVLVCLTPFHAQAKIILRDAYGVVAYVASRNPARRFQR